MRGVDLNQYCATLVQKDTEFHWLVAKTGAGKRVWRHRKHQLGNRVADTPASTSMTVRRSWLRRLGKTHDEKTWPQACPMTYGGFSAKILMPPIYATILRRRENRTESSFHLFDL